MIGGRPTAPLVGTLAALAVAACSLVVDTNADQCHQNSDCPVPGDTCSLQRVCVPASVTDGGSDAGDVGRVCSDQACCSAAQCMAAHGGEPYACPRPGQACVRLKTDACPRLLGAASDPSAILLGVVGRISGDTASLTAQQVDAMELAVSEVNSATLGIPGAAGAPARPVAAIACDEGVDTELEHLIDELHVPAIVALGTSGFVVGLTPKLVATDTFMMCANCGSPALTTLDDHDLVWRTQPTLTDSGKAEAVYFAELESKVRAADAIAPSAAIKLAAVSSKAFIYAAATESFATDVRYNGGKTALANQGNFLRIDYDDPGTTPGVDLKALANQVIAYAPQVVAISGSCETLSILSTIEDGWTTGPRPYYLGNSGIECPELFDFVAARPDVRARVRLFDFVPPVESASAAQGFGIRLKTKYASDDPIATNGPYDGMYGTLYAVAAVDPSKPLTGSLIAAQVPRLAPPAATKIPIGPNDFPNGVSILRKGSSIDLIGVFTDMNFDANGDVHGDSALLCVAPTTTAFDAGAPSYGLYFTQRIYTSATGTLSGVDDCP